VAGPPGSGRRRSPVERTLRVCVLAALVAGVPGCARHTTQSFMARAPDAVWYLDWQRTGSKVAGDLRRSVADRSRATGVATARDPFAGLLEGSHVTLTFGQKLFSSGEWTGTLSGSRLSLTYEGSDGGSVTLRFILTDAPAYASALQALTASPSPGAEGDGTVTRARIDKDDELVRKDLADLRAHVAAADAALAPVKGMLELAQDAVRAASRAALQAELRVNHDRVCAFAGEAAAEAARVSAYASQVLARVATARSLLGQIREDMDRLGGHHSQLVVDLQGLPAYRPAHAPTNQEITNAIASGARIIRDDTPLANQYESSANTKVPIASGYSAQARAQCAQGG
jgi:hypothetical protein